MSSTMINDILHLLIHFYSLFFSNFKVYLLNSFVIDGPLNAFTIVDVIKQSNDK